jgi:hypothetical protein
MNLEMYKAWKKGEVVVKLDTPDEDEDEYEIDIDKGDPDTGFLSTWGNFFAHQYYPMSIPKEKQKDKNVELLEDFVYDDNGWTFEHWPNVYQAIEDYKKTGILTDEILQHSPVALYLTQEEYEKHLHFDDCQSPFIYFGEDTVVLGKYYRT